MSQANPPHSFECVVCLSIVDLAHPYCLCYPRCQDCGQPDPAECRCGDCVLCGAPQEEVCWCPAEDDVFTVQVKSWINFVHETRSPLKLDNINMARIVKHVV